jgi:hypothetical protein
MVTSTLQVTAAGERLAPIAALERALEQLAVVVGSMAPEDYCCCLFPGASGSIGQHVRHCLDHVTALVSADSAPCLSYDKRDRGTPIETDPVQALRRIQVLRIKVLVDRWSSRLDEPVCVVTTVAHDGTVSNTMSTLGRELAFVLDHVIHHQAMIGLLASIQGVAVPHGFGFSPSTPRRRAE